MRTSVFALFMLLGVALFAQTPDFSMIGFATMNGGTTGGAGGQVVTPTNFTELQNYCSGTTPYIILIDREFKGANPPASTTVERIIRMGSNKTLLGVGDKGFINQIGIQIQCQKNIIIRNLKFTMKDVPYDGTGSEVKIMGTNSDPDCIAMQADDESLPAAQRITRNVWIDHCEFYNEDPAIMTDANRYDGMVDMKNDCQYVTISWCYFHDHHKGCLSGKGDSDVFDRKTTMHHNYFYNISSRVPLQRFGKLHMLNNYVVKCGDGTNVRIQSQAVVEKNYYKETKKPIFGKPAEGGTAREISNYFDNCTRLSTVHIPSATSAKASALSSSEEYSTNSYVIPYTYSSFVTEVLDVPATVTAWSGINKIASVYTSIETPEAQSFQVWSVDKKLYVSTISDSSISVYTVSGQLVYVGQANGELSVDVAKSGLYIVKVGNQSTKVNIQ